MLINTPPGVRSDHAHMRIRKDRINTTGTVTLRHGGRLYHIGVGRTSAGTRVVLLVQDLHIRIIGVVTGELLRELIVDPARDYQPTGAPRRRPTNRTWWAKTQTQRGFTRILEWDPREAAGS